MRVHCQLKVSQQDITNEEPASCPLRPSFIYSLKQEVAKWLIQHWQKNSNLPGGFSQAVQDSPVYVVFDSYSAH